MSKYFYVKAHQPKEIFRWCNDGRVYQVFKEGKEEMCDTYPPTDYFEYVKSGDWIPCTEKGYKLSYTERELEGKVLKAHKDGYNKEGECFCKKGGLYEINCLRVDDYLVVTNNKNEEHLWDYEDLGEYFYPVNKPKREKRPSENWRQKITEGKFNRCIKGCVALRGIYRGSFYNPTTNCYYSTSGGGYFSFNLDKAPNSEKGFVERIKNNRNGKGFSVYIAEHFNNETGNNESLDKEQPVKNEWTDKHYNFNYQLKEDDIEKGFIKLDPYFVGKQWKIGSKDDSGALWHCFKTIARFGDKNSVEREIRALNAQVKRMAEIYNVDLEDK